MNLCGLTVDPCDRNEGLKMVDLVELKRLAGNARPGPWELGRNSDGSPCVEPWICERVSSEDAQFIAAANPAAVLEMIERIEELMTLLDLVK